MDESLSGTGDSQRDSRESIRANRDSFAIETPNFIARQADSHESLEFPIRAFDSRESCESIRANHATGWWMLLPADCSRELRMLQS